MRTRTLASAAGSSALFLCLVASASSAQEASRRAPLIRVYSQDGGGMVLSNYVTPAVEVAEDAYVFAVMMDLDGRIQVLQPDAPGISVRVRANNQLRLPNFFAGFVAPTRRSGRYSASGLSYDNSIRTDDDSRGTVIALASRAPFKLDLITADGDWDNSEIRLLIENRSPSSAAQALARYLGAKGEPIGRDFMRFAGQRESYYAYDDLAYCGYGYGYGSFGGALSIANGLNATGGRVLPGYRAVVIGYDACGFPIIVASRPGRIIRRPALPRQPGDTTVFPKSLTPQGFPRTPGRPRHADAEPRPVPFGAFPVPQPEEPRTEGARIPAPRAQRGDPRVVPGEFRPEASSPTLPSRRPPAEPAQPRAAASGGMQPEYRPAPRVIERSEPVRAAPAPAPVIRERPSPPPAPRAEPARTPIAQPPKTEQATPPPRNR